MVKMNKYKIAIVASQFNKEITNNLVSGAIGTANTNDCVDFVDEYYVPGAFELPGTISKILKGSKTYDAIIAFGCVVKGETAHFEYISNSVSQGLINLSLKDSVTIPIMFGVLTTYNYDQALARSKSSGPEIMNSTIDTIKLYEKIN